MHKSLSALFVCSIFCVRCFFFFGRADDDAINHGNINKAQLKFELKGIRAIHSRPKLSIEITAFAYSAFHTVYTPEAAIN